MRSAEEGRETTEEALRGALQHGMLRLGFVVCVAKYASPQPLVGLRVWGVCVRSAEEGRETAEKALRGDDAATCSGSGEGAAGDGGVARRDAWGGGGARGGGGGYKGASPQFRILNSEH